MQVAWVPFDYEGSKNVVKTLRSCLLLFYRLLIPFIAAEIDSAKFFLVTCQIYVPFGRLRVKKLNFLIGL